MPSHFRLLKSRLESLSVHHLLCFVFRLQSRPRFPCYAQRAIPCSYVSPPSSACLVSPTRLRATLRYLRARVRALSYSCFALALPSFGFPPRMDSNTSRACFGLDPHPRRAPYSPSLLSVPVLASLAISLPTRAASLARLLASRPLPLSSLGPSTFLLLVLYPGPTIPGRTYHVRPPSAPPPPADPRSLPRFCTHSPTHPAPPPSRLTLPPPCPTPP
ncbi:hypothetical protein B0H16DRAFT_1734853 [Mycena metata]|uniref:Uncharacterized protein n=1 Tax=Mycena metata TaxID=1033252 RepID=A0AAD7HVA5_9AGAR|nr:hypothetical protein B0H16DRAFT_1734853 [Mycena metata]